MAPSIPRQIPRALCAFVATVVAGAGLAGAAEGLKPGEIELYRQWLQSLETTIAAVGEEQVSPDGRLYPQMPQPPIEAEGEVVQRHFSIARALNRLEASEDIYQAGTHAGGAFDALSMARNYWHLTEYDSALVWFERLTARDVAKTFEDEYEVEAYSAAIAQSDSLYLARTMASLLAGDDPREREAETILAFRHSLGRQDFDSLMKLNDVCRPCAATMSQRLRFWHVSSLMTLEEYTPALVQLRLLIAGGGLSHGLDTAQRDWVLRTIPDIYFLCGDESLARRLYGILAVSKIDTLRTWSEFQLAGMDLAAGKFLSARIVYDRLCESSNSGRLQQRACSMGALAKELDLVKMEGTPYGTAAKYVR